MSHVINGLRHSVESAKPATNQDMQISRIRLSDKTSRLHPRHVVRKPGQAYEPKVPVKVREWIGPFDAVADRAYFNSTEILACEQADITVTLPKPMTSGAKSEGRFGKQDFVYLPTRRISIAALPFSNGLRPRSSRLSSVRSGPSSGFGPTWLCTWSCLRCAEAPRCWCRTPDMPQHQCWLKFGSSVDRVRRHSDTIGQSLRRCCRRYHAGIDPYEEHDFGAFDVDGHNQSESCRVHYERHAVGGARPRAANPYPECQHCRRDRRSARDFGATAGRLIGGDAFFTSRRVQLAILAARYGLPAIYNTREFPAAGGLMSYGGSLSDAYRQTGVYIGKILRGAKPADLPVWQRQPKSSWSLT